MNRLVLTYVLRLVLTLALVLIWVWRKEVATLYLIPPSTISTIPNKTPLFADDTRNDHRARAPSHERKKESELDTDAPTGEIVASSDPPLCFPWKEDDVPVQPSQCCSESYCKVLRATTAYSPCCRNSSTMPYPKVHGMLITGTPRSGTVFVSSLLSSLGLKMANDAATPTPPGIVSWLHIYNDHYPYLAWTQPFNNSTFFRHVVQQVRDPLASITSIAFTEPIGNPKYIGFLARHITISDVAVHFGRYENRHNELRIRRALEFYTGWHEAIMALGIPRFRLEDFAQPNNTILPKLFERVGLPPPDPARVKAQMDQIRQRRQRRLQQEKVNHNQREHRPTLAWDELCEVDVVLTKRFFALSQTFGYYGDMTWVCGGE